MPTPDSSWGTEPDPTSLLERHQSPERKSRASHGGAIADMLARPAKWMENYSERLISPMEADDLLEALSMAKETAEGVLEETLQDTPRTPDLLRQAASFLQANQPALDYARYLLAMGLIYAEQESIAEGQALLSEIIRPLPESAETGRTTTHQAAQQLQEIAEATLARAADPLPHAEIRVSQTMAFQADRVSRTQFHYDTVRWYAAARCADLDLGQIATDTQDAIDGLDNKRPDISRALHHMAQRAIARGDGHNVTGYDYELCDGNPSAAARKITAARALRDHIQELATIHGERTPPSEPDPLTMSPAQLAEYAGELTSRLAKANGGESQPESLNEWFQARAGTEAATCLENVAQNALRTRSPDTLRVHAQHLIRARGLVDLAA